MSSLIFHYWKKRGKYTNADYSVTGLIICVIPHIRGYVLVNANIEYMKPVGVFIKTSFHGIYNNEVNGTLYMFCSGYTDFN